MAFNIIVLGASGVGKSSLITSLDGEIMNESVADKIRKMESTTRAVQYNKTKTIRINYDVGTILGRKRKQQDVFLKILDTAGQSKYSEDKLDFLEFSLQNNNIHGAVIVHDLSTEQTINETYKYYDIIKKYNINIPIIDIGNKSDLLSTGKRPNYRQHTDFVKKTFTNSSWIETSARTGENVCAAFTQLISQMMSLNNASIIVNDYINNITKINKVTDNAEEPRKIKKVKRSSYLNL